MDWIRYERKASSNKLRYYPDICLEGLKRTMENISQDSRSRGGYLNPGLLCT